MPPLHGGKIVANDSNAAMNTLQGQKSFGRAADGQILMTPGAAGVLGTQTPEDAFLLPSPFIQTLLVRVLPAMSTMDNPGLALGRGPAPSDLPRLIAESPSGMARTCQTGTTAAHDPIAQMTDGFAGYANSRFRSGSASEDLLRAHSLLVGARTRVNEQSRQMPPATLHAMPQSADYESHNRQTTRTISLGGGRPFSSFGVDLADTPGPNRVHNPLVLPAIAARLLSRRAVLLLARLAIDSSEGKAAVAQRIVQMMRIVASNRSMRGMKVRGAGSSSKHILSAVFGTLEEKAACLMMCCTTISILLAGGSHPEFASELRGRGLLALLPRALSSALGGTSTGSGSRDSHVLRQHGLPVGRPTLCLTHAVALRHCVL